MKPNVTRIENGNTEGNKDAFDILTVPVILDQQFLESRVTYQYVP